MDPRTNRRAVIANALLAGAIVLGTSGFARADTAPDVRWQPWLGCWTRAAADGGTVAQSRGESVCVIPAAGTSAVDIVTAVNGRIASRERIEATGVRRSSEKDGCAGWERAEWSPDGRRVYLQGEYDCPKGVKRTSSGLMAMSPKQEWLNVLAVTMGDHTGVRVLRHRSLAATAALPAEIVSALEQNTDGLSRTVAAQPVTTADIAEASRHVGPAVVEAWLSALRQVFALDAKRLLALADAGVPDRVIDVIVALSYPDAFAVKPSTNVLGSLMVDEGDFATAIDAAPLGGGSYGCGSYGSGFSLYGDDCFWSGYLPYSYSRYGYSPYGYDRYSGWYVGSAPLVITLNPGDKEPPTHGHVVNGRGYSEGSRGGGSESTGSSSSSSSSGGSGSSSSSSSSTGSSGGSSSGGDRTAQPR